MPETLDQGAQRTDRLTDVAEWPVRRKVALVLAVPLMLAAVLGGLRVQSALAESSAASATASQVTVLGPSVAYLSAAEDAAIVFRATDDKAEREAALKKVNEAAAELERAWASADLSEAEREQVRALLTSTQGLRDGSSYGLVSTAADALVKLEADVTLGIAGMTESGSLTESQIGLVGQLNEGRLAVTQQQLLVLPTPALIPKNELFGYLGVESAAIGNLELQLPGNKDVALLREYNGSNAGLLGIGTPDLKGSAPIRLYDNLTTSLLTQIEQRLGDAASASQREAIVVATLTGLALLLAIVLALVVSRFLVGPIKKVRDGALAVAQERLPESVRQIRAGHDPGEIEPIPVTTHEEMGQLARAVDDLHSTAVRLAQGEAELRLRVADMFVTLSRRNTSLVNQQLRLIESLETDEEDPERLSSLFRLDHLASRMRRTAESLVVLADAPTQHSEQDSLSVAEALQAATAGVQDYQRVRLGPAPDLRLTGNAAPDLVHLFTELVDNALAFSPPTADVIVTTETPAGMVLVEIEDHGLGMNHARLLELNETLRTGADVTAETARRMGVFVVSRLARRHGMTVTLERNAEGGTTAKVFIPRTLLAAAAAPEPIVDDRVTPEETVAPVAVLGDGVFRRPDIDVAPDEAPVVAEPDVEEPDVAEHDPEEPEVAEHELEEPEVAEHDLEEPDVAEPDAEEPDGAEHDAEEPDVAEHDLEEPEVAEYDAEAPDVAEHDAEEPVVAEPDAEEPDGAVARATLPVARTGNPLDALSAVINANIRLPQREPGTADQPSQLTPALSLNTPRTPLERFLFAQNVEEQVAEEPVEEPVDEQADEQADEQLAEQEPVADAEPEPALDVPTRPMSVVPDLQQAEAVADEPVLVPDTASPLTDVLSAPLTVVSSEDEDSTPLYRMLRSSWFSTDPMSKGWDSGEADAGWQAAGRANDTAPSRLTSSGLPVRDPGNRLVPGGVTTANASVRRDPDAIRARLAAHAAGVARGRQASGPPVPNRTNLDTTEDVTP